MWRAFARPCFVMVTTMLVHIKQNITTMTKLIILQHKDSVDLKSVLHILFYKYGVLTSTNDVTVFVCVCAYGSRTEHVVDIGSIGQQ
jgi:hypothetical protein